MPLHILKTSPKLGEKKVLKHIEELYKDVERDVYVISDNLLSIDEGVSFKPDFIILDPTYGISIIEVKSYKEDSIDKLDNFTITFTNGDTDLSPFKKCQDYRFKLSDYLNANELDISMKKIKTLLVFTNIKEDLFREYDYVESHYKNFQETLNLETLFPQTPIQKKKINDIYMAMNPVMYFNIETQDTASSSFDKLDEDQLDFVKKPIGGHYLISGIPGSGKSVAVVSRAIYIANEKPDWKILVLSENKFLKEKNEKAIRERTKNFNKLGNDTENNIVCMTLMKLLTDTSPEEADKFMKYPDKVDFLTNAILDSEIVAKYDAVLIDEYQDFSDDHIRIAKLVTKKKSTIINNEERLIENIFLSGDRLQKVKEKGSSGNWIDIGIEISGRSKKLKGSYRCGREIIDIALSFLKSAGKVVKDEVESYYEGTDTIEYLGDLTGSFSTFTGWDDLGVAKIHNWVNALTSKGVPPSDILIITPNNTTLVNKLKKAFHNEVSEGLLIGMPSNIKGLEAGHCAIYNFDSIGYHSSSQSNKYKQIYMCLTRARSSIFINCWKAGNEDFEKLEEIIASKTDFEAA